MNCGITLQENVGQHIGNKIKTDNKLWYILDGRLHTACSKHPVSNTEHLQYEHQTAKQMMIVEAHIFM